MAVSPDARSFFAARSANSDEEASTVASRRPDDESGLRSPASSRPTLPSEYSIRPTPSEHGTFGWRWFPAMFRRRRFESDLTFEQQEELRMMTGFTAKEIKAARIRFLTLVNRPEVITRDEFLAIPAVRSNPLRRRLLVCFGLHEVRLLSWHVFRLLQADSITFAAFLDALAVFNNPTSQRDAKLRAVFVIHDFDGDGRISKSDLICYFEAIMLAAEGQPVDLAAVADRVLEEASSHPSRKWLSLADLTRAIGLTDFESKLAIPFA
ncbi:unnamed protein product [Phaeothamnion confervicola]